MFGYGVDTFMKRFGYGKILINAFIYMNVALRMFRPCFFFSFCFLQNLVADSTDPLDTIRTTTVIYG